MTTDVAGPITGETQGNATCSHTLASLLAVSSMQIELAVEEGSERMQELGQLFTRLAALLDGTQGDGSSARHGAGHSTDCVAVMRGVIDQALISMQFYDRLSQRLKHVSAGLRVIQPHLRELAEDTRTKICADILEEIRARYSLEDEKLVFNSIVNGASFQEMRNMLAPQESDGSAVELF